MKKRILGFTLIELLIVITIIGILAVVFIPTVMDAPRKARDAARMADLSNVVKSMESAKLDSVALPGNGAGCLTSKVAVLTYGKYFGGGKIPTDPSGSTNATAIGGACATKGEYLFSTLSTGTYKYAVVARVEIGDKNGNMPCSTAVADVTPDTLAGAMIAPGTTTDCRVVVSQ